MKLDVPLFLGPSPAQPFFAPTDRKLTVKTNAINNGHGGNGFLLPPRGNRRVRVPQQVLPHVHTVAEFLNQLVVPCGVGLTGILGSKVTEKTRLMIQGDRKRDAMEILSAELDGFRRRKELRENISGGERTREWADINVDSLSNIVVVQPPVPPLAAREELERFDSLLGCPDTPVIRAQIVTGDSSLPSPSEFILQDDDLDSVLD